MNLIHALLSPYTTPFALSLFIGGIFTGIFTLAFARRFFGVLQQEHYRGGAYLKWYYRKGNMAHQRVLLFCLALALLTALFNICFCFLEYRAANLVALVPFTFLFVFYELSEEKYALKVKTAVTHRLLRLCICAGVIFIAVGVGACFACAELAAAIGNEWYFLFRFVPVALEPLIAPHLVALANFIMCAFEIPHGKSFVKKAKKALAESACIKVGITGSFGKTSVKNFAYDILSQKYKVIATPASFNTPLGIARTVNAGLDCDIFLAEMGARRTGDIKELCEMVKPTHGVVTGVCCQHLETFGSLGNIKAEKGVLARYCENTVLGESVKEFETGGRALVWGEDFAAEEIAPATDGTVFYLRLGEARARVKIAPLGAHAAEDAALAAALCLTLGMSAEEIFAAVESVKPVEHRLQLLEGKNGVHVLDDAYNSNVEGAREAVEVLRLFSGEKYIVTPGLVELGELEAEENRRLGEQLVGLNVVLVGETLVRPVKEGYLQAGGTEGNVHVVPTLEAAQVFLSERLQAGDCVLFLNDLPDIY